MTVSHPHTHLADAVAPQPVSFTLNGDAKTLNVRPFRRLLDVLRTDLALPGTKEGCGEGECGACSVLIDGEPVNACLVPVIQCDGATVVTIEGLASHAALHPVQEAFVAHGGAQCGICTPGMVVTAAWMADNKMNAAAIREKLSGNICRCTGYSAIVNSVAAALGESE
ncbi:MAG: (2Fe-2S)-binding protein [Myxococcales bacterium]|nr:(2Fe-2S)-binding protein [Myxococcales bacterium]